MLNLQVQELCAYAVARLQTSFRTAAVDIAVLVGDTTQRFFDAVVGMLDLAIVALTSSSHGVWSCLFESRHSTSIAIIMNKKCGI